MIYVCSDLHGYPLEKFRELLQKAGFGENDTLYILGDVVDRNGDGGVEMLRWIMQQGNIRMLRGNHESMLLSCIPYAYNEDDLTEDELWDLDNYVYNGGKITLKELLKLKENEPAEFERLVEFINNLPLYEELEVNMKKYVLVHGGLGNFSPHRKLKNYSEYEIVWERPNLETRYFRNKRIILGHTPTACYGKMYNGKVIYTETWINIDVGAAYGYEPLMLRLDDMAEFHN